MSQTIKDPNQIPNSVPKPLVQTNQAVIVISVAISILTGFHWILLLPFFAGIGGIFFGKNFVILSAKRFLKKKPSEYLPEDKDDLKFNQKIASSLLGASLIAHAFGFHLVGNIFSAFVLVAATVALAGFCVGCFIRFQIVKHRQAKIRAAKEI
jgi:hypothetical protein